MVGFGWNGLEWVEVNWNELKWVGVIWNVMNGMEWVRMGEVGCNISKEIGMCWNGLE